MVEWQSVRKKYTKVAAWHQVAFGKYRGDIDFLERLRGRVHIGSVPTTLVAVDSDGTARGCASLIESDVDSTVTDA